MEENKPNFELKRVSEKTDESVPAIMVVSFSDGSDCTRRRFLKTTFTSLLVMTTLTTGCATTTSTRQKSAEIRLSSGGTKTLPCGSPLPAGATCICNCVAAPVYPSPPSTRTERKPCGSPIPPGATCTCNCI